MIDCELNGRLSVPIIRSSSVGSEDPPSAVVTSWMARFTAATLPYTTYSSLDWINLATDRLL